MSNSENQKRYRENRAKALGGSGEKRLNCWISSHNFDGLEKLAEHYSMSKKDTLNMILTNVISKHSSLFVIDEN